MFTTGNREIDAKLGGGIPPGSLVLIEGHSDAGKSVLSQHLTYGAVQSKFSVAYYTSENTVRSLLSQMASLSLDVLDYFLMDRLRIYPLKISIHTVEGDWAFPTLLRHFSSLPQRFQMIITDSITNLVTHSGDRSIIDFFSECKALCDAGRTIFLIVHSHAFNENMLIRVRSLCDGHLRLRLEEAGERLIKVLEVLKMRNAERTTGNIISFDVEPQLGIRVLPVAKAKV
jgi:flagellar protein FlaH